MKYINQCLVLLLFCMLFGACSDDNDPLPPDNGGETNNVTLTFSGYSDLTHSKATVTALLSSGGNTIIRKGFYYATSPNVGITGTTVEVSSAGETMTAYLMNLSPKTTYYIKAFAATSKEVFYSTENSFTTLEETGNEQLAHYKAPSYPDNYTNIANWSQRNQWNLANVHDPTVMKADDGYYYMYQTNASYGNAHDGHGHFHGRRSKDLVNWEYLGASMPETPSWVKAKLNEMRAELQLAPIENPAYGYWAPVVRNLGNGTYRMYYCVIIDNYIQSGNWTGGGFENSWTERAFIGMMETTNPAGNVWEDKGYVLCSSTDRELDWSRKNANDWSGYFKWNAIDPSYIATPEGEHWLIYGSWHSGILAVKLDPTTGKPSDELGNPWDINALANYGQLIHTRKAGDRWQGSEAPEIVYNPQTGYYYLFMAYDELSVAYNTRVARSKNITGPYIGIDGANVTAGADMYPVVTHPYKFKNSNGWVGISHCAVFDDGNGNWYYSSQGRLPHDVPGINASNAVMMGHVRSIRWTPSGWPVVMPERYGAVPEVKISETEIVGNWEHIDLSYSYGKQKEATAMTFAADHKITAGPWKGGTWSFDAEQQILTANGIELCLQRETDWEASPRTHTLVYAGYNGTKTYWGKKGK